MARGAQKPGVAICLFRGINVGGNYPVRMSELCELFGALGFGRAQSYIQSGNVVFEAVERDMRALERRIAGAFREAWTYDIGVMVRSLEDWRRAVAKNPFKAEAKDGTKLSLAFLASAPSKERLALLDDVATNGEQWRCDGTHLYLSLPNGTGRSKLPGSIERLLKIPATLRNWNTVQKLLEIAEALAT